MESRLSVGKRRRRLLAFVEQLEVRRLLSANLVISEFMASNSTGIQDQYGNYSDWIEIHNAGDTDANLGNYFLTDNAADPQEWQFPQQTLAAGGYLIVFADGMNNAVAGKELDTNFKLGASGEYLGLINAADDSVQFDYSPTYPVQTANISYGLSNADDPNSARVYFSVPSPGQPNAPSVASPVFSQAGIAFTGTINLTLTDTTPNSTIYYTTDNSTPTTSSTVYTGPISITRSEAIRAVAAASGLVSSPLVSQTYERVDSTVTSVQNQNLPVIIIDTYGATMNDTTFIGGSATVMNTTDGTTNILGTADYQGRIGIHIRGSTSEGYPKQQYTIHLWDENDEGKKVSLLGMPADDSWVLYAPYTELSLMQNQLAYQWSNEMGDYASRTQFVEVYMSTGGNSYAANTTTINYSSNYMGVYILEEKIKIGSDRVNVDEMSSSNPNGGFIIEQDRYSGEDYFTTPQGVHMVLSDPDDTSLMSNISSAWDAFENALFTGNAGPNQPWDTPGNADYYGNFIDIKSFVDYFLLQEMTRNIDAFWLSTYYTKAADTVVDGSVTQRGLISAGPQWDFNLALGAANYNLSADAEGWDTDLLSPAPGAAGVSGFNPQDPYFQRLLTDPNFVQAVSDRWNQLRQGVFSTSNLDANIQSDVNLLSDNTGAYPVGINPTGTTSPVMRNFQKWPELGVFVTTDGMYDPNGSWIQDVGLMQNWLAARVNWMDSQFIPEPVITPGGDFSSPVTVNISPLGPADENDTALIGPNSNVQYMVPSRTNQPTNWYLPSFDSSSWSTGQTGLGYDVATSPVNFLPYINTNVQSLMLNHSADLYLRTTFTISDPSQIQALILSAQYDDGFIAWVNGARVMDANSPENTDPAYNTSAAGSGDDNLAITYREFDITAIKNLLVAGTNVLAIQGLNSGTGSNDFLLSPTLSARTYTYPTEGTIYYTTDGTDPRASDGSPSASAIVYSGGLALNSNTQIKARTYVDGSWSALADQTYTINPGGLRITEMMYHPPGSSDSEFVELQNTSALPIDLDGYQFTSGISLVFSDVTLAPGQYGVIVQDAAEFAATYGNSPNVLGVYSGSLSNSGETVTLSDPSDQPVESFTYKDSWYPSTDGDGYSLVVVNPDGDAADLNTAAGWRASDTLLGAPGYADSDATVPAVNSWTVDDGGAGQPSIQFDFNTYISSGSAASLTLTNQVASQPVAVSSYTIDDNKLTFLLDSSLSSGVYQFTLPAGAAVNASGIASSEATAATILLVRAGQAWSLPPSEVNPTIDRLAFGAGGALDLGSNILTVEYDPGSDPAGTIASLVNAGYANGVGTGPGIISSATFGQPANVTAVGYFDNGSSVKVGRSWSGDTNLDGKIDADDMSLIVLGQKTSGIRWQDGNFNYDTKVNADDWLQFALVAGYSKGQILTNNAPAFSQLLLDSDTNVSDLLDPPTGAQ